MGFVVAAGCALPSLRLPSGLTEPAPVIKAAPLVEIATNVEMPIAEPIAEPILDAWETAAKEDGPACRDELKAAGYKFQALPSRTTRDKDGCGIPNAIVLYRGPTGIAYDPAVMLDCSLARTLGQVEPIVQEEAETHLHSKIARIGNAGAYACRPRNFRKGASLSAHASGAALDVSSFHPVKGTPAVIDRDYSGTNEARKAFLHAVYSRLRAHETDLTYVVGPDFNALHHNHFHLDRGGWAFWGQR